MTGAAKFGFGQAFEVDADGYVQMDEKPKPRFTEEDLAAARGEGQKIGYEAGLQQARQEIEAYAAEAVERMVVELTQIGERHAQAILEIQADAAQLALTVANKLAPELMRQQPLEEVKALVGECLAQMTTEPRIVVRVGETLVDALHEEIDDIAARAGFAGKLVLIGEPGLQTSDCRIEWADGGAERDLASLSGRVDAAVERYRAAVLDEAARFAERAESKQADVAPPGEEATTAEQTLPEADFGDDFEDEDPDALEARLPTLNRMPGATGTETQTAGDPGFDEPQE